MRRKGPGAPLGLVSSLLLLIHLSAVLALEVDRTLPSLRPELEGKTKQSVAIIGGGVGGASCALFLRDLVGPDVSIDVYERGELGGRASSVQAGGQVVELGASIIHRDNRYVAQLAAAAGLRLTPPASATADDAFAVFDGRGIVFVARGGGLLQRLLTLLALLWRYGLTYFTFQGHPANAAARFAGVYPLHDQGTAFTTPAELLGTLGLYDLTQDNLLQYWREHIGTSASAERFASELLGAVTRANYNQGNEEVNALAGLVSALPATDGRVLRVEGGNAQLASGALAAANTTVHAPAAVELVRREAAALDGGGGWVLEAAGGAALGNGPYDAVILAAPLELAGLRVEGVDGLGWLALPHVPSRKWQRTVATIVRGTARPELFGLDSMPGAILVTEDATGVPFNSLSLVGSPAKEGGKPLYKLLSTAEVPHAWLSLLFAGGWEVVAQRDWAAAYPRFDPPEDFAPFTLDPGGLYYVSALESAASALEVVAVAGRNVALLAAVQLRAAAGSSGTAAAAAAE